MRAESLAGLASLAGQTVVTAAVSDAWEAARCGFARLLGRGDPQQAQVAEQRLEETRQQLAGQQGPDREQARAALAERWAGRLADVLEEHPDAEAELRALVQQIRTLLPAGAVAAADHSVAGGRDVTITASGGGIAAGVVHGSVAPPGPFRPGPGEGLSGPGFAREIGYGSIVADRGGTAIGRVVLQRREVTGKPVRLAPRPLFLAGREELLAELDDRLSDGDRLGPRIVALCGLGGTGKTTVAVEYAHRHLDQAGMAWQLACEDPAVLMAGFSELAAQLGVRDVADTRDPVASVHGVLAAYPREWLLLFDNVPDRASIEAFLPPGGHGRVLITSQNQTWPPGQALDVPVLDPGAAAGFLAGRTGDPDRQAATELAGELDGLPLALEQAAAYTVASGGSLAAYLASFRQRREAVLARGEPTGYPKTVATTWSLAFEQLEEVAGMAVALLRLLACCAPEAIPLRLLLQPRPGLAERLGPQVNRVLVPLLQDSLAAGDAIAALRRHSLVTPGGRGSVLVHRLVQAVTVDQMTGELAAQWRQAATTLIEAAIPDDPGEPETWPAYALLLPHARLALPAGSAGMSLIADYLGHSGSYTAARDLCRDAFEARVRAFGPEYRETRAARAKLARWTGKAGDAAAARDQFAALLPAVERVSGPEHPEALAARANLARFTGEAGDAAAARDQFAALLPIYERVLGPDHPETLATVRADVARFTGEAGDAAAARDQYAALLPAVERVFGHDHSETLSDRANLARFTGEAGDPAAARDQFAALVPLSKRILGLEHPKTLLTRASLAHWAGLAGDPAAARDQYAALLPISERVLAPEHPDTLTTRNKLAYWTGEAGNGRRPRPARRAAAHTRARPRP